MKVLDVLPFCYTHTPYIWLSNFKGRLRMRTLYAAKQIWAHGNYNWLIIDIAHWLRWKVHAYYSNTNSTLDKYLVTLIRNHSITNDANISNLAHMGSSE